MIPKPDLSKFIKEANDFKSPSSADNPILFMAKAMLPQIKNMLSTKIKAVIFLIIYLILTGLALNAYFLFEFINYLISKI